MCTKVLLDATLGPADGESVTMVLEPRKPEAND
jgi:hypothetical protein